MQKNAPYVLRPRVTIIFESRQPKPSKIIKEGLAPIPLEFGVRNDTQYCRQLGPESSALVVISGDTGRGEYMDSRMPPEQPFTAWSLSEFSVQPAVRG